jgi:hypothetical protein
VRLHTPTFSGVAEVGVFLRIKFGCFVFYDYFCVSKNKRQHQYLTTVIQPTGMNNEILATTAQGILKGTKEEGIRQFGIRSSKTA